MFTLLKDRLKDLYWKIGGEDMKVIVDKHKKPFVDLVASFDDQRVNESFAYDNQHWTHEEVIAEVRDVMVEPEYCYVIQGFRTIIDLSRKKGKFGVPSPLPVVSSKISSSAISIDTAILFDGSLGTNYFYFHTVLLSKLYLLQEYYDLKALPVLVGKRTFERAYFQDLIKLKAFSEINWKVVSDAVSVKNLVLCVPSYYEVDRLSKTKKLVLGEGETAERTKKIFVDRTNRRISNFEAFEPILKKHGFEVVNPGNLNLTEQARLFNEASHVIGIHGAGLANLIFCEPEQTKFLEITPSNLVHTHYYWLCATLGIHHNVMVGEAKGGVYEDFLVDLQKFDSKVEQLLTN